MPLDPDAQRLLDMIALAGRPAFESVTPEEARTVYTASRAVLQPDKAEVAETRDLAAPGMAGPIRLRLYRGAGTRTGAPLPALVYFHGGGWVLGDLDSHDGVCRRIANEAGCVVVSVDYRLAPEHRFPAAVDDSAAATAWVMTHAESLGIDPNRIAVGGDSAGGNLAAVVALIARDGGLPGSLCFQALIYPATDMVGHYPSHDRITAGYPLTTNTMRWFINLYLPESGGRARDWRASPILADNLSGVCPALVMTAYYDPLFDEGEAYAQRLDREGVRVTRIQFSDQIHGFLTMGRVIRASDVAIRMLTAALGRAWSAEP